MPTLRILPYWSAIWEVAMLNAGSDGTRPPRQELRVTHSKAKQARLVGLMYLRSHFNLFIINKYGGESGILAGPLLQCSCVQ